VEGQAALGRAGLRAPGRRPRNRWTQQDKRDSDASAIYTVETFAAVQDRDKRLEYVHGLSSSVALLAMYEYARGLTLLRVSHDLTPDQATAYDNAVKAIVKS
jgi:hypothetical protein